jgi:hypothetical protein
VKKVLCVYIIYVCVCICVCARLSSPSQKSGAKPAFMHHSIVFHLLTDRSSQPHSLMKWDGVSIMGVFMFCTIFGKFASSPFFLWRVKRSCEDNQRGGGITFSTECTQILVCSSNRNYVYVMNVFPVLTRHWPSSQNASTHLPSQNITGCL